VSQKNRKIPVAVGQLGSQQKQLNRNHDRNRDAPKACNIQEIFTRFLINYMVK
jgi:hypothetical protein